MLAGIISMFHIGLHMYQSANGFDYLRILLFHTAVNDNMISLQCFVLECLNLHALHKVWGVVCNNASNHANMLNWFKKFKMKCLTGPTEQMHYLPHILNLTSKVITLPFLTKCAELEKKPTDKLGSLSSDEDIDLNAEDKTGQDNGCALSCTLNVDDESDDELDDIYIQPMEPGSHDEKELKGAKQGLYKPENYETMEDNASQSNFGYLSYMDEIFDLITDKQDKMLDPVNTFIKDKIIIEHTKTGKKLPVNPLAWWHTKQIMGEHHDGLTQMAIDVLSTPALSVEVEHAFSFVSVAAKAKAQAAVAEAEAIAAEEMLTEGSGDEDGKDVLGPSSNDEEEVGGGVSSDDK
ncbi:hypothetical protein FRC11_006488 [Ceratobasidium sp. 423]|nr:hypothetical protein FRC11_006488 [Ceratobasidium sp. 423]